MPDTQTHLHQARHNEKFLGTLNLQVTPYLDWAVTMIFYAALHYIRALAAHHQFTNISSYPDMDRLFQRLQILRQNPDRWYDYRQLKDDSRVARYECRPFPPAEVMALRDQELERIKNFVLSELPAGL